MVGQKTICQSVAEGKKDGETHHDVLTLKGYGNTESVSLTVPYCHRKNDSVDLLV